MIINHHASGSSGNCITVSDGQSSLMLDAGLSFTKLSRKVKLPEMDAFLITHEHMDHAKAIEKMIARGYVPHMSEGTAEALGLKSYDYHCVRHLQQFEVGTWVIVPFNLKHDAAEPMGYLFQSTVTGEKGVFIVDSAFVRYDFPEVSHYLIEANYSEKLLDQSDDSDWLKRRIQHSHFSLDDLKKFLKTSDLSKTQEIHLLHVSARNGCEVTFKDEIQALTGIPTYSVSDQ